MVREQFLIPLLLALSLSAGAVTPQARRALLMGDCGSALAEAGSEANEAEALALARCELRLSRTDAALARLARVRDPALSGHAALVRGEALLGAGRWEEAAAALAGLAFPGPAHQRAQLMRGRALIEAGRFEEGRVLLSGLLAGGLAEAGATAGAGGADPGEVRWWLAQGAIRRGEPDKAIPVMQKLWARNPGSPWAGPAEAWLTAQGLPLTPAASAEVLRERIETLEAQREYPAALALRDALGDRFGPAEEAAMAFRAKDYPRAAAAFARLEAPSPSQRFDHALATSRTGDYAAAASLYRALVQAAPESSQADEASFKLGYLAYDKGDLAAAVPLLQEHLGRYPASKHADEARWFIGWSLYKQGDPVGADAALAELLARHPSSTLAPQAAYWRARIQGLLSDSASDADALAQVLRRYPGTGAAWMAAWRLGRRSAGVPVVGPPPNAPAALQGPAWERGRALSAVGLQEWARAELQGLEEKARAGGPAARIALALALAEAGDFTGGKALAAPLCGAGADPWALRACQPRPSAELVDAIALPAGLDPLLPAAIANAESALKPWVTSPAGARGLMQLMPALARVHHAQRYPDQPYDPDLLYDPTYNAVLGTTELASLQARFRDAGLASTLPLVIAGYNGGPEAVEHWLAAYPDPPELDRFIEDVGFTETRRYVKRVLGYLQGYRAVYGDPPG